jgi:hypothetical protein
MYCSCFGERELAIYTEASAYSAARKDFLDHGNQLEGLLEGMLVARWPEEALAASRLAKVMSQCLDCNPLKRPKKPSESLLCCLRDRIGALIDRIPLEAQDEVWETLAYKQFKIATDAMEASATGAPKTELSEMQRDTVLTVARNLSSLVHVRSPGVSACAEALASLLSKHFKTTPFIQRAVGAAYLSLLLWTPQESGLQISVLARLASTSVAEIQKQILQFLLIAVTDHAWADRWLQP